jgi:cytochrome c peroxidase
MKSRFIVSTLISTLVLQSAFATDYVMTPTKQDKSWLLPVTAPYPADNKPNAARIELGKKLFFDTRLSGDGNMSCATCHNPVYGWSDGLPTAKGFKSEVLGRASPTVTNTAFNGLQMWDGRKKDLEDQATGPLESEHEMAANFPAMMAFLNTSEGYKADFAKAYPGEPIDKATLAKAIATFERSVISNNSPFDRWVKGDKNAMTKQQVTGFRLFTDPKKGNCSACHQGANFTDNGFHNLGLASYGVENPDLGRYTQRKVTALKGAFKTPTLRDVALTAPYFHDGSAKTLKEVVAHYNKGGEVKTDLSPNIKPLNLSEQEMSDIVAFMEALTSKHMPLTLPELPLAH